MGLLIRLPGLRPFLQCVEPSSQHRMIPAAWSVHVPVRDAPLVLLLANMQDFCSDDPRLAANERFREAVAARVSLRSMHLLFRRHP